MPVGRVSWKLDRAFGVAPPTGRTGRALRPAVPPAGVDDLARS